MISLLRHGGGALVNGRSDNVLIENGLDALALQLVASTPPVAGLTGLRYPARLQFDNLLRPEYEASPTPANKMNEIANGPL